MNRMAELMGGFEKAPPAPWLFACAGRYHMEKYGTSADAFAKVAEKNHRHRSAQCARAAGSLLRVWRGWCAWCVWWRCVCVCVCD